MSEFRLDLGAIQKGLKGHSIFAPSSSAMWMNCAGSLIPNLLAQDTAGEDAAYGTVGHAVGEQWLREGRKPHERIGEIVPVLEGAQVFEIEIDHAMIDFVEQYVLWCAPLPGQHFVETKVYFSHLTPLEDQGGTADHVVCQWQVMTITDLKMGIGERVYAMNNSQALLYALGFFYEWDWLYDFQKIVIRIAQPRLGHFDEWTIDRATLLAFAEVVKERSHAAWVTDAPRTPSPKACRWCKVAAQCTARLIQLLALARGDLSAISGSVTAEEMKELKEQLSTGLFALELADPTTLTTDEIATLYPFIDSAKQWWEKLNGELYRRAMAGQQIPTAKLVQGRAGARKWKNPTDAKKKMNALGIADADMLNMCTPAQMEEHLRRKGFSRKEIPDMLKSYVTRSTAGLILVPASDKRKATTPGAIYDNAFDDLDDTL